MIWFWRNNNSSGIKSQNHKIDLFCETFLGLPAVLSAPYQQRKRGGLASFSKFNFFKENGITAACSVCLPSTFNILLQSVQLLCSPERNWYLGVPPPFFLLSLCLVCNFFIILHHPFLIILENFIYLTLLRTYLVTCKTKFSKYEVPAMVSRWLHELNQQEKWHSMDHEVYFPVLQKSSRLWMHPKPKLLVESQTLRECMLH